MSQGVADSMLAAVAEGEARVVQAELLAELLVREVVHQVHRDLGDARRELLDLDAVELVDVNLGAAAVTSVRQLALATRRVESLQSPQDLELEPTELSVRDDQEVAAAAGRVEEAQPETARGRREAVGRSSPQSARSGLELIEEQRLDDA